jgi:hypothetical protein
MLLGHVVPGPFSVPLPGGFICTGNLVDRAAAGWPLEREPLLLETSQPGLFAIDDVRAGSVKRVASAVGEGAITVNLMYTLLAERLRVRARSGNARDGEPLAQPG